MRFRPTALLLALAALAALAVVPAGASAASSTTAKKRPAITRVTPMRVRVGASLTIRGRNFSSRRSRNTVIFRASNGRTAFTKPRRASRRKLVVRVPTAVTRILAGAPKRFKLRVLTGRRFSRFTPRRLSPVLVPSNLDSIDGSGGASACTAGDEDGDLLAGSLENAIGTDACLKDTDGDGVQDGFEYKSAIDLNDDEFQNPNSSLPYPGRRPYPNPLDPSDAAKSYDGDTLVQREEQSLWNYAISHGAARSLSPLEYSDGEQYSKHVRNANGRRVPSLAAAGYSKTQSFLAWASSAGYRQVMLSNGSPWYADGITNVQYGLLDFNRSGSESASELLYYDLDGDGWLNDDERDEDADGLTNYDEAHGRNTLGYWNACYNVEKPYYIAYANTSPGDADSDGDGVRDGADDQDHDDVPNIDELSRFAASGLSDLKPGFLCTPAEGLPEYPAPNHAGTYGRVNPFNPCLPAVWSRTCPRIVNGETGAPFDASINWLSLN